MEREAGTPRRCLKSRPEMLEFHEFESVVDGIKNAMQGQTRSAEPGPTQATAATDESAETAEPTAPLQPQTSNATVGQPSGSLTESEIMDLAKHISAHDTQYSEDEIRNIVVQGLPGRLGDVARSSIVENLIGHVTHPAAPAG